MRTQTFDQFFAAPLAEVFDASISGEKLKAWRVPDEMTMEIHTFEAHEGGRFRISLHYQDPNQPGKSGAHTDTFAGHFATLIPHERIVEVMAFESGDPDMRREMRIETRFQSQGKGTRVTATHYDLPASVKDEDNEAGWRMSWAKLARLVER